MGRRQVLSLLVENTPGVVSHVSGLFSRRGFNIEGFSVGVTADSRYTRITVVASGDQLVLEQIEKQLAKLEDVVDIKELKEGESVRRELILVKVHALPDDRQLIISMVDIYHGRIVDISSTSMIIEMTGDKTKLDSFLELISEYEILELARTGATGLSRGEDDVIKL